MNITKRISFILVCTAIGSAGLYAQQVPGIVVPDGFQAVEFAAGFARPFGIAFAPPGHPLAGHLFVADNLGQGVIWKVSPSGDVSVFVSPIPWPDPLAFDAAGNLFVGNSGSGSFSFIEPGTISKIPPSAIQPDGTVNSNDVIIFANIVDADGLASDGTNLFVGAGRNQQVVKKVTPTGVVSTVVSTLPFTNPDDLALTPQGDILVGFGSGPRPVLKVDLSDPLNPLVSQFVPASEAGTPFALAIRPSDGTLLLGDDSTGRVLLVSSTGQIEVFATGFGLDGITGIALDSAENVYVSQLNAGRIVKISPLDSPPIARAGTSLDSTSQLRLDATLSADPDGDPLTFDWTVMGPAETFHFTGPAPLINSLFPGDYSVTLIVSDGTNMTSDSMPLGIPFAQPIDPEQGVEDAMVAVNQLVTDPGTVQELQDKLAGVTEELQEGDIQEARVEICNFVEELQSAVEEGSLSAANANLLLGQAASILAGMTFE